MENGQRKIRKKISGEKQLSKRHDSGIRGTSWAYLNRVFNAFTITGNRNRFSWCSHDSKKGGELGGCESLLLTYFKKVNDVMNTTRGIEDIDLGSGDYVLPVDRENSLGFRIREFLRPGI